MQYLDIMEIFRSGEIEINETLTVVVLYIANCTVLPVQPTIASYDLRPQPKFKLGWAGVELEIEVVVDDS